MISQRVRLMVAGVICLLALAWLGVRPAQAEIKIVSADGQSFLKFGYLLQGSAESLAPQDHAASQNLYLRRARVILGGKVNQDLSFFIETDSPNMGKVTDGVKSFGSFYLQDAFVSRTFSPLLTVDGGLILLPGAYNHLQSAASLLAVDYGPYTFTEAKPLQTNVGRDLGIQARSLLAGKHLEYRLAMAQGARSGGATKPFRATGRLMLSPYQLESGYFYAGTTMGKKSAFCLGMSGDVQDAYTGLSGDLFTEQLVGRGCSVTLQGNYSHFDGRDFQPTIARQNDWMAEAGFSCLDYRLVPFTQIARQDIRATGGNPETRVQGGLCWRMDGASKNIKLAWTRTDKRGSPRQDQILVQFQAFQY